MEPRFTFAPCVAYRSWRTGTGKAFWALMGEGRYRQARALLETLVSVVHKAGEPHGIWVQGLDAEAFYELARLYRDGLLGYQASRPKYEALLTKAAELGHPRAAIGVYFANACLAPAPVWEYVLAQDDALAKYMAAVHYLADQDGRLRYQQEAMQCGDPEALFEMAVRRHGDLATVALLGLSNACASYIKLWTTNRKNPEEATMYASRASPTAEHCFQQILWVGAQQGEPTCVETLAHDLVRERRPAAAARIVVATNNPSLIDYWMEERDAAGALEIENWDATEVYIYGKWLWTYGDVSCDYYDEMAMNYSEVRDHEMAMNYSEVRDRACDASTVLLGLLRRRRREMPRDVASIIGRLVWDSRELQADLWGGHEDVDN
jgi:hypothetical protein